MLTRDVSVPSQGISSNASGSLLIKPCVQAEIDFYESAKDHPLFLAHMPTFVGALNQHSDQDSVAPLLDQAVNGVIAPPSESIDSTATEPTPGLLKRATWKPSGGKKLSTGLAIVLENATSGFQYPNVLDVKLGARLWDDDAPVSKRRKLDEVAEQTTSGSLGFRVAGMKVYIGDEAATTAETNEQPEKNVELKDGYRSYDKNYGRAFNKDNVIDAFTTYLGGAEKDSTTGKYAFKKPRGELIARRILRELQSLQYVLENEESRMYSASVLFVYEGDDEALETGLKLEQETPATEDDEDEPALDEDGEEIVPQKVLEARIIDFAHASWTPGQGPDENALRGIRSLVAILNELLA